MDYCFWVVPFFHLQLTGWKLIGFSGTFLFSARWLVQLHARRSGQLHLPKMFWYMSVVGSSLLLIYFVWGKNDSVGVLSNAFPALVAFYNMFWAPPPSSDGPANPGPGSKKSDPSPEIADETSMTLDPLMK